MQRINRISSIFGSIASAAIISLGLYGTGAIAQEAPDTPDATSLVPSICASQNSVDPNSSVSRFCPKLLQIPVFTVTGADGSPIVTSVPLADGSNQEIGGVFLDPNDAQAFVTSLQERQPELLGQVQVSVLTLAEIYEADRDNHIAHEDPMEFAYVPSRQQLQQAADVFAAQNVDIERFDGVPLFFATSRANGGYMTIEQNDASVIPVFFDKSSLDLLINNFGDGEAFQNSIQYEVLRLERVLQTMQVLETLEQLDQIVAGTDATPVDETLIPSLPEMMVPEVLAILSQGENNPLAAAIAMRLQDRELAGNTPLDRVESLLTLELDNLIESGTPSPVWQSIREELDTGLGDTLAQVVFFPSPTSVQFIQNLLGGADS
jgi:nickel transport protein